MGRPEVISTEQVLEAIRAESHQVASIEDVSKHLGRGSLRTIRRHITALRERGLVEWKPGKFGVRLLERFPEPAPTPEWKQCDECGAMWLIREAHKPSCSRVTV